MAIWSPLRSVRDMLMLRSPCVRIVVRILDPMASYTTRELGLSGGLQYEMQFLKSKCYGVCALNFAAVSTMLSRRMPSISMIIFSSIINVGDRIRIFPKGRAIKPRL